MKLERFSDPAAFLAAITPALARQEARNSLILGIVGRLIRDPGYAPDAYLARVMDGEQLVLAAMRTPPFGLVLTDAAEVSDEVLDLLIDDVLVQSTQPPDVNAPKALSLRFSQGWSAKTGGSAPFKMMQGLYELTSVNPDMLRAAPGELRQAADEDEDRLVLWREGFERDAFGDVQTERSRAREFFWKRQADIFFWEHDGATRSMALRTRPSANGVTVGMVYTPSEHRKQGYATALVAHLSQFLLDSGYQFCTLYTDLANPTSNHIYQQIGYRQVELVDAYHLQLPGEQT